MKHRSQRSVKISNAWHTAIRLYTLPSSTMRRKAILSINSSLDKFKPRFRYRTFFKERALAFDGMRQACLADKPDMDNLYVKYYLAYLHEKWENQKGKLD